MASIKSKAIRALSDIYQFAGSVIGAQEVDLDRPISVVHDLSRQSELARGFRYTFTLALEALVGATNRTNATKASILALRSTDARLAGLLDELGLAQPAVWVLSAGIAVDDANNNLAGSIVSLFRGNQIEPGNVVAQPFILAMGNDDISTISIPAPRTTGDLPLLMQGLAGGVAMDTDVAPRGFLPTELETGDELLFVVESGGGGSTLAFATFDCWIGIPGTTPP